MSPAFGFFAGVWMPGLPEVLVMVTRSADIDPDLGYWPPGTAVVTPGFVSGHQVSRSWYGVWDFPLPDLLHVLAEAVYNADQ